MILYVNAYVDRRGKSLGTLLSLSPSLHIRIEAAQIPRHFGGYRLPTLCEACAHQIERHAIAVADRSAHGLRCRCLEVLFRDPPFSELEILGLWPELRKIKARAETKLAPLQDN
jgi:hypothetical protein